jgi:hypothetical protein
LTAKTLRRERKEEEEVQDNTMMSPTKRRSSTSTTINGGGDDDPKQEINRLIPKVGDTNNHQIDNKNSTNKSSTTKKTKIMVLFGATIMVLIGVFAIASKNSLVFAAVMGGSVIATNGVKVKCKNEYMPDLTSPTRFYRYSKICYPDDGKKYPLHFFAHGDFGGGPFSFAYDPLITDIVSQGFVVSMYLSCSIDQFCNNGETSFLEVLKSMSHLENYSPDNWWNDIIDFNVGYTASGHSTGGRVVLMLAALKDNPTEYLMGQPDIVSQITPEQRVGIQKFKAFIADHPDPMYNKQNPDVTNFKVTSTPILIITGSKDIIEPELSAWKDFSMITSPFKVYIDMKGARHVSPIFSHTEGPYIGYFSQCFINPDSDISKIGCGNIYGKKGSPDSMRNILPITPTGGRNTGNGKVGYLGCGGGIGISDDVPVEFAQYCKTVYKE